MMTAWRWSRRHLFGSWFDRLITVAILAAALAVLPGLLRWAVIDAVWWAPDRHACPAGGDGACWAFVLAKARFILFGRYPYDDQWRPALASLILAGVMLVSGFSASWRRWGVGRLGLAWGMACLLMLALMHGVPGLLRPVSSDLWGGLPVTMLLSLLSMAAGFPLALLLALGRQSSWLLPHALSVAIIEGVRGVPLVGILFMMTLMLPFFLPDALVPEKFWAALAGFILFLACYWAEDIRAGLMAVPRGQIEAAHALGLSGWQRLRYVLLPQALALVVAPMVGNAIGNFKNTSVVVVVGLFDMVLTTQNALLDPAWSGPSLEAYLFLGSLYLLVCLAMARYGHLLERLAGRTGARS